jgi:hypothetical protein
MKTQKMNTYMNKQVRNLINFLRKVLQYLLHSSRRTCIVSRANMFMFINIVNIQKILMSCL